ncbi:hypothetical protein LPJ53_004377 [Coemansia erecta]|uniref:NAD(P)-binding protein n=1 Tax=Coemansia erecta TaxID=147472 RepID=A0A9W8CRP7_9FUNG|nr:hypothetical protein LPJ53_004377 [Coemansia erecta]
MPSSLKKLVVVTGASRGIGRAVSEILVAHEVTVIGVARSADALQGLAQRLAPSFIACAADITTPAGVDLVHSAVAAQGDAELAGLVNNAGVLEPIAKLADVDLSLLRAHLETNVVSVVSLTQRLLPQLRASRGRVVNVSSGAATGAYQGWGAYCMGKAALNMLTQVLACEEDRVVAVSVRPGVVATDMQALIRNEGGAAMKPEQHCKFTRLHSEGALLPPERPAASIACLAVCAEKSHSGMFYSWDSPEIAALVDAWTL